MTADAGRMPGAAPESGAAPEPGAATLVCPLCGAPVIPGEAACGACPVSRGCGMICCARCGYRFVERSAVVDWIGRVWRRLRGAGQDSGGVARDRAKGSDGPRRA